jgi:selenide,water dikinase
VGSATGDDAAVYRLDERTALVFTTDFFTPIVDDPFDWGRIAAANALSDVYAMGGRPVLCLNIVGWPVDDLPLELLGRVLEGGQAVATEAGALVAGGHTVDDKEPKYGMAVVGLVDPGRIVTNAAARPGDILVLTKPLGIGTITTGIKRGLIGAEDARRAVEVMARLNRDAAQAMAPAGVRAATDVTGFGLLGHLQKMLEQSGAGAEVWASAVPVLEGAAEMVEAGAIPGGTQRNRRYLEPFVRFDSSVSDVDRVLLADAQTSGGLLICCPPDGLAPLRAGLAERGVEGAEIGVVSSGDAGRIEVLDAASPGR